MNPTAGEVAIEADNANDEANESEDAQSVDESSNKRVIITTDEDDDATIDVVNVKMEERGKRRSARVKAVGQQEKAQASPDKSGNPHIYKLKNFMDFKRAHPQRDANRGVSTSRYKTTNINAIRLLKAHRLHTMNLAV